MPNKSKDDWLSRPLLLASNLNGEQALYLLFVALALISRLWDLGAHVMSHDETVHSQWSWYLYRGAGYQHHPLSHGPFLFHFTALSFYLFGDNDFSARLVPAIMGVVLVALPYALRRWLGRSGALVASFLLLISPSILYYSRYTRNDVPIVVWSLIAGVAIFRYLDAKGQSTQSTEKSLPGSVEGQHSEPVEGGSRWLMVLAAALSLLFATKEVSFFYIGIFGLFLMLLFSARMGTPRLRSAAWERWRRTLLTLLGLATVIVLATGLLLLSLNLVGLFPIRYRDCGQAPVPGEASGEMQCSGGSCELVQGRCQQPVPVSAGDNVLEFDQTGARVAIRLTLFEIWILLLLIGAITVIGAGSAYAVMKHWMPFKNSEWPALDLILFIGSFTLPFLSHIAISGLSRVASRAVFGVDAAFDTLDYSTAGLLRSAGFVAILLAVSAAVGLWWDWRRWLKGAGVFYTIFAVLFTTFFTNGNGLASGMVGSLGYWLGQQAVERGSQPLYYYALMVPLYEYLPLVGFAAAALYALSGRLKSGNPFVSATPAREGPLSLYDTHSLRSVFLLFVLFWTLLTWPIYSIAGEKMPWMTVHFAVPMILASGWILGKLADGTDWRAVLSRAGCIVMAITPVAFAALVQTVSPWLARAGIARPFSGLGLGQLNTTLQFLSALFVLSISGFIAHWAWKRLGTTALVGALTLCGLGILALLTIRTAWAFAYVNYDDASEFLVYAHGSPDVRVVMEQIETISRRTSGERALDIGYTADGSYPIMWYLRNYSNAVRLANPPNPPDLNKSVIVAGDLEWGGIQPYLGDDYVCHHYNFMWWPMQDYYGLTWDRIRYALTNAEMRSAVWDIVFRRDYQKYEKATGETVRLSEWPLRDGFRFCVRRDTLAQMWGANAAPVALDDRMGEEGAGLFNVDGLEQSLVAELEVKSLGQFGAFNAPHGVARDADDNLYVADTNNHRIVKLSSAGYAVDAWSSTWWQGRQSWKPNGCLDEADQPLASGDGEFCEPWGVATGPDGKVYVADTWNHRVQVFSAEGEFLSKTGSFGLSSGSVSSAPAFFFGPRDIAVDLQGTIYVSDTGNKRIQVFDGNLDHLYSFGGPGMGQGRLDEPVGLAIGPDRLVYVADTWNHRMQVLTPRGDFVRQWPAPAWERQSTLDKPYVALDDGGCVYVSDPEGARIIVFDAAGTPLAVLKGAGNSAFQLPTAVLIDGQGRLWVSDAAGQRLLRFPPLTFSRPCTEH